MQLTTIVTKADVDQRIDAAGADLRALVPNLHRPVRPEEVIEVADRHQLPIGLSVENDPVARTIFVAAFCGGADAALEAGREAVWQRFEALSRLSVQ